MLTLSEDYKKTVSKNQTFVGCYKIDNVEVEEPYDQRYPVWIEQVGDELILYSERSGNRLMFKTDTLETLWRIAKGVKEASDNERFKR